MDHGTAYDRVVKAARAPNDDSPETREEKVASLAAAFLDLQGREAVETLMPQDLTHDIRLAYPGFIDWFGEVPAPDLSNEAWELAYAAIDELDFSEVTTKEGLFRE